LCDDADDGPSRVEARMYWHLKLIHGRIILVHCTVYPFKQLQNFVEEWRYKHSMVTLSTAWSEMDSFTL